MAGLKFGQASLGLTRPKEAWGGNFASMHGLHTGNAEEGLSKGTWSFKSLWRKNDMDLLSMLLPHRQRNFAGHPDKCPAEALPRNKALQVGGMLG